MTVAGGQIRRAIENSIKMSFCQIPEAGGGVLKCRTVRRLGGWRLRGVAERK